MDTSTLNGDLEAILSGEPTEASCQENLTWPDQGQPPSGSGVLCRLCAEPCGDISLLLHFKSLSNDTPAGALQTLPVGIKHGEGVEVDNYDLMLLIDKTLPIKVSQSDPLPKQVCIKCVERLKESYSFVLSVINAETRLRSMADTKCFCASEVVSKEEESASSPEIVYSSGLVRAPLPSGPKYCCPLCSTGVVKPSSEPPIPLVKKLIVPEKPALQTRNTVAWDGTVIKMERDEIEPTPEELERSYRDLFDVRDWRTERPAYPRAQPAGRRGYKGRPRGRPRGRTKMIPRGKRGAKRLTHTTVERILELSGSGSSNNNDVVRVRSGGDRLHADALTQCLLCEGWLPGMAACLQHSLATHTDCGVFLCPRCQQDDFPGEFELIQHFQEHHCPDLELCEGSDDDAGAANHTAIMMDSFDSSVPADTSIYSADVDLTPSQSRLSPTTGNLVEEIKQNGDTNIVITQELSLNSFLEDKDLNMSITEDLPATVTEDPGEGEEDREETEEQDPKSDSKLEYRKDPDDPEGGGGNSFGGNNNVADDSNSFENGDSSSQNTQPEFENDAGGGTNCGDSLNLARTVSDALFKSKTSSLRHKKGVNFGRKPRRKRLKSTILSNAPKKCVKTAFSSKHQQFPPKCVGLSSINVKYADVSYPTSTFRKRLTKTPLFIHWTAKRRKES